MDLHSYGGSSTVGAGSREQGDGSTPGGARDSTPTVAGGSTATVQEGSSTVWAGSTEKRVRSTTAGAGGPTAASTAESTVKGQEESSAAPD